MHVTWHTRFVVVAMILSLTSALAGDRIGTFESPMDLTIEPPGTEDASTRFRLGAFTAGSYTEDGRDRTTGLTIDGLVGSLELLARAAGEHDLLRVTWRGGEAYAKLVVHDGSVTAADPESFDCEAWSIEGAREILLAIGSDTLRGFARYPVDREPSAEALAIGAAVVLVGQVVDASCGLDPQGESDLSTPGGDESGEPTPQVGACHYDNQYSYYGCKQCCETESGIIALACSGFGRVVCTSVDAWFCEAVTGGGCNAVTDFTSSFCVYHNCKGLPGDPGCPDPEPACTGLCRAFCSSGWNSECGSCPGPGNLPIQRHCCS